MIRFAKNNIYSINETRKVECKKFELSYVRKMLETSKCIMVVMHGETFYCYHEHYADYINIDFALSQLEQLECLSLQLLWKDRIESIIFEGCSEWVFQLYPMLKRENINVVVESEIWDIINGKVQLRHENRKELRVNINSEKEELYREFSFVMEILQFNRWKIINDVKKYLSQINANVFTCTIPEFGDLKERSEEEEYRNKMQIAITNGKLNINDECVMDSFQKIYGDDWKEIRRRCSDESMQHWLQTIYDVEYYLKNRKIYSHGGGKNRCYLIGPCIVEGNACPEGKSFPDYLQKCLDEYLNTKYKVVAISIPFYVVSNYLEIVKNLSIHSNDITICIEPVSQRCIKSYFENWSMLPDFDLLPVYDARISTQHWFADTPGHTSVLANEKLAEYLVENICKRINFQGVDCLLQRGDGYLLTSRESQINAYFKSIDRFQSVKTGETIGAVIMECNPITLYHENLVGYARGQVDYLYIFIYTKEGKYHTYEEETDNINYFIKKWDNIKVNPFIKLRGTNIVMPDFLPIKISSYLERQLKKEREFDMQRDIEIFVQYVVNKLNISVVFAGQDSAEEHDNTIWEGAERTLEDNGVILKEIPKRELSFEKA